MIIKHSETELELLVKDSARGSKIETRLATKMLPASMQLLLGRTGRIQNREIVGMTLPFDDAVAFYRFLHKRFGRLTPEKA